MKNRIIWFIIFVLAVSSILVLTMQTPEQTTWLSEYVRKKVVETLQILLRTDTVDNLWWNNKNVFRKLAHIPEYLLLGVSVYGLCSNFAKKRSAIFLSFLLCGGVSLADEIIKGILPTREFDIVDMIFDFIGYSVGILILRIASRLDKSDL